MIPMATSSPAPTLQPSDANVVYISIFVSVAAVLCGCLLCGIVCCGWVLRWIWKRCHQTPDDHRLQRHKNQGAVDEYTPLIQNDEQPREGAGAGERYGIPRSRTFSTAGVVQYPKNERRQSAIGDMKEWSTTRAAEGVLKRLCLIPSGVDQLTIYTTRSDFPLGKGDATLIVEEGTVEMETIVRYAVILNGPFVYSAGYKPASVVVYLNLEGANLQKPLKLMIKHWCKPVESNSKAVLKLLRAPLMTGEMENIRYIFHEVRGDSLHNTSTFTISEPQCLYCVEMEEKSQASYNAIAFQMNLPKYNLVKFRIQFMCDSLDWNAHVTEILEEQGWENNNKGDPVSKFFFRDKQITATPHETQGPGWQAAIHGHQSVRESDFLDILGKEKDAVIAEVRNGRYPPCIYYKVLYTSVAERRKAPGLLKAELHGADVNLFFTCSVFEERAAEAQLKDLCLIPSGVDQLTIYTTRSDSPLGNGDATLIVDEGTVEMETVVRYAVILHGPFVYSAGFKPASVVVYLNLEGANLQKPLKLMLKHWCKPVEVSGALKLLRAPHTTGEMENFRYIFNEVQGVLLHNTATFTISEPQCLYCVEMEKESQASYNAIAFQKNLPEDGDVVKFRIQLMCDCLEWNAYLTEILEQQEWENNNKGDPVAKFFFCDEQITATPHELHGPGWQAAIHGHQSIRESDFLAIMGKECSVVFADIQNGRYPPCIYYKVLYTSVAERRQAPGLLKAELHGADVKLFFTCKVFEEQDELGLATAEQDVTTAALEVQGRKMISHSKYCILQLKDLLRYAVPRVSPKWEEVGLQLDIAPHVLETVKADHSDVEARCKAMFQKWLHSGEGTGKQPRAWESVLEAVRRAVGSEVYMNIEEHIVQDVDCPSDPPAKKTRF